jgi:hypothetical protein
MGVLELVLSPLSAAVAAATAAAAASVAVAVVLLSLLEVAPSPRALRESDVFVEVGKDVVITEGDDVNGSDTTETASAAALISAVVDVAKASIPASGCLPR